MQLITDTTTQPSFKRRSSGLKLGLEHILPTPEKGERNYAVSLSILVHNSGLKQNLTKKNEERLRQLVLEFWASRKRKTLEDTDFDLSGACKLVSQLTYVVFPLSGNVFTNYRHAFVRLHSGDIYDMNRECNDVQNMYKRGKDPYEIDIDVFTSAKMSTSLATWNNRLRSLSIEYLKDCESRRIGNEKWVHRVPTWAKATRKA